MRNLACLLSVLLLGACVATAGITFYTDQTSFETLYPGLTKEDYSNTNVPVDDMGFVTGPFNSLTDNKCFSPGDIVEGISLDNDTGRENVVATPPIMGLLNVAVGPRHLDVALYSFSVPVNAFGISVLMPIAPGVYDINVFGASGSLGTSVVIVPPSTPAGVFWGVYSDEDITKIAFEAQPGFFGIFFTKAQFGALTALDNSTWGSIKNSF
ncbi:MAG: hypothetical protein GQ565_04190 [Candidatus Aegiribacteria sp.]|nr:hypothetical protein [Candidatus Aegiribacteria sp.]